MKDRRWKSLMCICLLLITAGGVLMGALAAGAVPSPVDVKSGVTVHKNDKATIDASNLTEGFLSVAYTGGKDVRIKVQISKSGGTTYTYDLNNQGRAETLPITEGDGTYTVKVFENTGGTKYAQAYSVQLTVKLRDQLLPFLYPSQYVNYTADSQVVSKAAELTGEIADPLEKVRAVYDFVTDNFTYDNVLAATVKSGYLPEVDKVLAAQKGICFDYSAVMSSMLRSQGVPCKLVIGYAGKTYHAWINVYVEGEGWIDKVIFFDGKNWTMMDPTFVSSGKHSAAILKYVTTASNYAPKYAY